MKTYPSGAMWDKTFYIFLSFLHSFLHSWQLAFHGCLHNNKPQPIQPKTWAFVIKTPPKMWILLQKCLPIAQKRGCSLFWLPHTPKRGLQSPKRGCTCRFECTTSKNALLYKKREHLQAKRGDLKKNATSS